MGTPSYMAPEQAVGNRAEITRATDVYGLGAVLYHLLTGNPPFAGGTSYETIKLVVEAEPKQPRLLNPRIDRDLSTICLKCLEKDPKLRYPSALALAEDIEHWLKHEPILARHAGVITRAEKWIRRNPSTTVLVMSLLAFAIGLGVLLWNRNREMISPKGIAVLPFENVGDKDNGYLAEGIQDEVLNDLARIADLKVISRTSVMGYRPDKARNLRQIGRTLGVRYVLEGSMQGSKDQIRIRTQLIDSKTDTQVWAEQYEGAPTNVLSIESEIAKTIAEQLQAKLSPSEKLDVERTPTGDLTAFDLYLRGRYSWNKRSTQGLERSIDYFNAAIQRDPKFILAYVGLAESYDLLIFYADRPPDLFFPKVDEAAKKALQINERIGQAHVPLARVEAYYRWNRDAALSEFRRALELNPNDETAHHLYGEYLIRIGLTQEGMRELSAALKLSPGAIASNQDLGTAYYALRRYDQAIEQYQKTLQLDPNFAICHAFLGMAYAAKGLHAQAVAELQKAIATAGERPILMGMLGHTLASAGRRDDASRILQKLILRSQQSYVAPLSMALIYAGLDQKEKTLELLEKAYAEHDPWLVQFLRNYHQFDQIRPDSRFAELMQQVGVSSAQNN
jgi:TolB-like protein/Tfp pilus assembly protein PilF